MVKRRHCARRKTMMVYGDNTISHQSSSDVSSNMKEWSHSWAMSKPIKKDKKKQAATVTVQ